MKKDNLAFVWDLDGTVLDSYDSIVGALHQLYAEWGIKLNPDTIRREITIESAGAFIEKMEQKTGISFWEMEDRYSVIRDARLGEIKAMEHVAEVLEYLDQQGIPSFVFTHRGSSSEPILERLGLLGYFKEIVSSKSGFPRKPNPQAVDYLVEKYHLDRNNTYLVGDRTLDIDCAVNAHIKSIMFIPSFSMAKPNGKETHLIHDLFEIKDLVERL